MLAYCIHNRAGVKREGGPATHRGYPETVSTAGCGWGIASAGVMRILVRLANRVFWSDDALRTRTNMGTE